MKLPTATAKQVIAMDPCWLGSFDDDDEKKGRARIRRLFREHGKVEVNALEVLSLADTGLNTDDALWLACHLLPRGLRVPGAREWFSRGHLVFGWARVTWGSLKLLVEALEKRQASGR